MFKQVFRIYKRCFLILFFAIFSCQSDDELVQGEFSQEQSIPEDIIAKLKGAGFYTDEGLFRFKDGYIVENDIFFTEKQIVNLPTLSTRQHQSQRQYITHNLVEGTRTLYVYMHHDFRDHIRRALDEALARYNALNLRLQFKTTLDPDKSDIQILGFYQAFGNPPLGYASGFPENGNPAKTIWINHFYTAQYDRDDMPTIFAHEIGHTIGFRHTDLMDRSFSCGGESESETEAEYGANHVEGTPIGSETDSWMLACTGEYDRPFTLSDRLALYNTYGKNGPSTYLYRYWNPYGGDHFYTQNKEELGDGGHGYGSEGIQCRILISNTAGAKPLYRYFNQGIVDHLYLTDFSLFGNGRFGFKYEGIVGYVYDNPGPGRIALYRYWNPGITDHFYTTNYNELRNGGNGWIYEGIVGYVMPK